MARDAIEAYNKKQMKRIDGWFSAIDAEIFRTILNYQSARRIVGSVAEIGTHHGKSFIPLCLSLSDEEKALCIDVFDLQEHNIDGSGHGSMQRLLANLRKCNIDLGKVEIVRSSSMDINAADLAGKAGPVRFFSVDGGHWKEIVKNDLNIAADVGNDSVVIALDDFSHRHWPEVSIGFFEWHLESGEGFEPVAISSGKLYLARKGWAATYRAALQKNRHLEFQTTKWCRFLSCDVPIIDGPYRVGLSRLRERVGKYMKIYRPGAYSIVRRALQAMAQHQSLFPETGRRAPAATAAAPPVRRPQASGGRAGD